MKTTADPYNFEIMVKQILPEIENVIMSNVQKIQPIIEEVIDDYESDYRLPKIYINAISRMLIEEFATLTHEDECLAIRMFWQLQNEKRKK